MDNIFTKINKAALKFLQPLTEQQTYAAILEEAIKLVKADEGSLFLWKDEKLQKVYASSPEIWEIKNRKKGLSYKAFKANKSFIANANPLGKIHPVIKKLGLKSVIFIPLSNRGTSIGILGLHSKKDNHFTQKELKILELFGSMASLAIRKTQLIEEVKSALQIRDQFISLAAHELRTPLTAALGYSELLYRKKDFISTSDGKWIEGLYPEMVRMKNLINELLDINKIRVGQFDYVLKECHLTEIVERAIRSLQFRRTSIGIYFQNNISDNKDIVIGDYDKLLQVVINLLDNAAKHSTPGSKVEVSMKRNSKYISLCIKDHGSGISDKDLPRVFDQFYKGEGTANMEGMGIGLNLCKHIIDYHRGQIGIKSRKNMGTVAKIKLPGVNYAFS